VGPFENSGPFAVARASLEVGSDIRIRHSIQAPSLMSDSGKNSGLALGKQIGTLFDLGALGAMPDRSLLDHFARGGEAAEAAFATLVERHGPLVLRVCRHVLADGHLAEDAFQVTFLLLARRARTIHDPDALAGWLHRVARRVALRAHAGAHRLKEREERRAAEIAVAEDNPLQRDELCAIVHEEIDRLVDAQRLPILLCALEGLSHEEAAQRLRWPLGTVKSRLVRGRRSLQSRLARRGLAPALTLAAGLADTQASAAPVPLVLAMATTKAAIRTNLSAKTTVANVSASVARMLEREMRAMFIANVRLAAGAAFAVAVVGIGITVSGRLLGNARGGALTSLTGSPAVASVPIARGTGRTSASGNGREAFARSSAIPAAQQDNRKVTVAERRLSALGQQVDQAIQRGVAFLKSQQRPDGSWSEVENDAKTGMTSLVSLALLAAGEKPDSPTIKKSLGYLRGFGPNDLHSTYSISLQTMAYASAEPANDIRRIGANVEWLQDAQIKPGDPQYWPGSWSYSDTKRGRPGDSSNTQYALLGLHAASEVGVPVKQTVWELARGYWERGQKRDGSWAYTPDSNVPTASMTCAGISSLAASSAKLAEDCAGEIYQDGAARKCGADGVNSRLQRGSDWLAGHFRVDQNFGAGNQWRFYYLYGLERAGRLTGTRVFGQHDWYRLGAEELMRARVKEPGGWQGALVEREDVLSTSFALLFLAKGRAPVLINKLRHGPANDWNNDPDDVRNLVGIVSRDWKRLLTWQTVDSRNATVLDLLRAPILFINGHRAPEFSAPERANLRAYVEAGGTIVADACCASADFDRGFRKLMEEMFPDKKDQLRPLPGDHAILRGTFLPDSERHPLWGIDRAARTAVIYSPKDLSCYWNLAEHGPPKPAVLAAIKLGQNAIDYATGRVLPPDKLSER
jgi:RNA polymerase sigma factor (sigma-70 family)